MWGDAYRLVAASVCSVICSKFNYSMNVRRLSLSLACVGFSLLATLLLAACGGKTKQTPTSDAVTVVATTDSLVQVVPTYAEGFSVQYVPGGCLVTIQDPQKEEGEAEAYKFALVKDAQLFDQANTLTDDYIRQAIPVRNVICMTSLQLSNFIRLEALDRVVGITSTRHIFNQGVKDRLQDKRMRQIGIEGNFDSEVILSINPDLILISPFKRGGYDVLKEVGIPLMPHMGYKENTPLGASRVD